MSLGKRLDELREERGISVRELARRLGGVAPNTVSRWIEGDISPRLDEAIKLAAFFEVSLGYLAYDDRREGSASSGLTADEEFVLQLYRDMGIGREEAVRRLTGEPGGKAREVKGVAEVITDRDRAAGQGDKGRLGFELDPEEGPVAERKDDRPRARDGR